MKIFHNISAMLAGNALDKNQRVGAKSIGKLSSGLRINSASDDAAGLSISEKMRSQIAGLDQARRNSQDGISMIQTAEGALNESHSVLQRMRELSVQAANDTLTSHDRQHIQREMDQMVDELDNIAKNTKFNKKRLLDGSASALWSVSDPSVGVVVRGGLDVPEGNFMVTLTTKDPGQAEVKKSHIFPIIKDGKELSLSDIPSFYDNGRPILDPSKSLYLDQGNGKKVEVVVYSNDTVEDLRKKLDDAVGKGLGQSYSGQGLDGFFSSISSGKSGTVESIRTEEGTVSLPVKPIDEVLTDGVTANFTSGAIAFAAITKGSTDVLLHINDNGAPDSIQVFTRDGVLLVGVDPPEVPVPLTEANGFLPGATYQPTGPLVNPAYNNVSPYNQVIYKGTEMAYSGSDNPGSGDLNEYFFIKESPEDLLVFVTGSGVFDITGTWTEIKKQTEYSSDYSLSAPLILRSAVPGGDGRISISGDDDLLNALGFSVVQEAIDPLRQVLVTDAHSEKTVTSGMLFSGSHLVSSINSSLDLSIDPSMAVGVSWNDDNKGFSMSGTDHSFFVHICDNRTVLQTGANEGDDFGVLFGDVSSRGLGLLPPSPSVLDRDSACRTLSRVDKGIDILSSQRNRLGSYQNRLEHSISNVTTASQNLVESESRIRDLDMAKEMMNFTKINILLQSGNSILAQANQSPEGVLQLLKGQ